MSLERELPKAQTILLDPSQKRTAGDWVVLEVTPPSGKEGAEPQLMAKIKEGSIDWGQGKILWFKQKSDNANILQIGLTSYSPGDFKIAPIPFVGADGALAFTTEEVSVTYESIGEKAQKKNELQIYPPQTAPLPVWIAGMGGLLGIVLLFLLVQGIRKIIRMRPKKIVFEEELTPMKEFERAKANLIKSQHLERKEYKKLYYGTSESLKRFLGKAYFLDIDDKTTREIIESLRELKVLGVMNEKTLLLWKELFDEMDIIKFTDVIPEDSQANTLLTRAMTLVAGAWRLSPAHEEWQAKLKDAKR